MYCYLDTAGLNGWCKLVNEQRPKARGFKTNVIPTNVSPLTNRKGDGLIEAKAKSKNPYFPIFSVL